MRRATSVCQDVIADLEAGRIRQDSASVEVLAGAIQQLQQRVKQYSKFVAVQVNPSRLE
jgi:hypothetical protein